jgi:carbonic anhydrase
VVNNGHTVQVNHDAGSTILVAGIYFEIKEFHFHAPSEHTINGQHFELEMHLVHQSADGELAVVGLLIGSGGEHLGFAPVWDNLPTNANEERSNEATLDADDLLPASRLSYRYSGSLTTPPCSEGVKWIVLTTSIEMSEAQIATFKNMMQNNNRPVQAHNGREIMVYSALD